MVASWNAKFRAKHQNNSLSAANRAPKRRGWKQITKSCNESDIPALHTKDVAYAYERKID